MQPALMQDWNYVVYEICIGLFFMGATFMLYGQI